MGFSFPPQVIQINVHITDTFFFNPYGIHIGFSQVITTKVVQEILFANQFLVFGWYAPCSYSLYSKLLFTNESLSLFQLYTDGKCNEEKWTFYPLKNQSTKRVKRNIFTINSCHCFHIVFIPNHFPCYIARGSD